MSPFCTADIHPEDDGGLMVGVSLEECFSMRERGLCHP